MTLTEWLASELEHECAYLDVCERAGWMARAANIRFRIEKLEALETQQTDSFDAGAIDLADIFGVKYPLTLRDFLTARLSGASMAEAVLSRLAALAQPARAQAGVAELVAQWRAKADAVRYQIDATYLRECADELAKALAALGGEDG